MSDVVVVPASLLKVLLSEDVYNRLTGSEPVQELDMSTEAFAKAGEEAPEGVWTVVKRYKTASSAGMSASYYKSRMSGKWLSKHLICSRGCDVYVYRAPKLNNAPYKPRKK